jgi:hypothetical protein
VNLRAFAAKARGLELAGPPIVLDMHGLPHSPCPACGGRAFHQEPDKPWRCSGCAPPTPRAVAGASFASLPDPDAPAPPDDTGPRLASPRELHAWMIETCAEEIGEVLARVREEQDECS